MTTALTPSLLTPTPPPNLIATLRILIPETPDAHANISAALGVDSVSSDSSVIWRCGVTLPSAPVVPFQLTTQAAAEESSSFLRHLTDEFDAGSLTPTPTPAYIQLELRMPALSTGIVLAFFEAKLSVVFIVCSGSPHLSMCDHPLAAPDSIIVGVALELIMLSRPHFEARKPLHLRVKSFMGQEQESVNLPNTSEGEHCGVCEPSPAPTPPSKGGKKKKNKGEFDAYEAVIVDLGNACWVDKHFSEDIQTRQYRCPEVILGAPYDTSADMWSLGCIIFELLTGDLLFDPKASDDYDRDEDHMAMFQELLGKIPKKVAMAGKHSKTYFNKKGELKHITKLNFWGLHEVLEEKYGFEAKVAAELAGFVVPLLSFNPKKRATAEDCLKNRWLAEGATGAVP